MIGLLDKSLVVSYRVYICKLVVLDVQRKPVVTVLSLTVSLVGYSRLPT